MAYENKIAIESCIKKVHKEQGTIEKAEPIINEIEEVYHKAKAFDEIKKHVDKEVDNYSDTLLIVAAITVGTNHICKSIKNNKNKNDSINKYIDRLDDDNIMG